MVEKKNANTGLLEVHVPAIVKAIREEQYQLNNNNKTPYQLGNTEITYPDGAKEDVLTRFYSNSISKHPKVFAEGQSISIVIQIEGDYAGRAVAQLPGSSVDIERLLGKKEAVDIPLTTSKTESIISDNVIEEELVV